MHRGAEENTPSAHVFYGGFRCFGCTTTYGVPRTSVKEPEFPYLEEEIYEVMDPYARLPDIDWEECMKKRFFVCGAPMGCGKTHQAAHLCAICSEMEPPLKVLVVSFRRMLAMQTAARLNGISYTDVNVASIYNDPLPGCFCICLNSVAKLARGVRFDVIILDEAGLTRRHFLSATMSKVILPVYERFCELIRASYFVCIMQDGITGPDVQFYTDIAKVAFDDRDKLLAFCMKKPTLVHPIMYTSDRELAVQNLLECYAKAFNDDESPKICLQPFMVFCTASTYANFLVELLQ